MARNPSPQSIAESRWKFHKRQCPICKHELSNWYCPNCGIPTHNSSFCLGEGIAFHCGAPHFRSGFRKEEDYQLCDECYAPNPYKANFCKNCGKDISSQARDKNGHGWVDLGLSVLWSTESLSHRFLWATEALQRCYMWNDYCDDCENATDEQRLRRRREYRSSMGKNGKDAATYCWGDKWRTPTKEEFEELITKCTWEKCIVSDSHDPYALKATGPNGNSIIITLTFVSAFLNNGAALFFNSFWSSTCLQEDNRKAYQFIFYQKNENTTKQIPDKETYDNMWLTTPIKIEIRPDGDINNGTIGIKTKSKILGNGILPVADKKWQGKL